MMRSLADELKHAEVGAFLAATDEVMNSNTLLLKFHLDASSATMDCPKMLWAILRSPVFGEAMLEADRNRDWHNFIDLTTGQRRQREGAIGSFWLVEEGGELVCVNLDPSQLRARFLGMLCDSFSPFGRRRISQQADGLVSTFIRRLLAPSPDEWCLHSVEPNFLWSTGYYADRLDFGYFDGGDNDSATLMHRQDIAYLLLTNGSP